MANFCPECGDKLQGNEKFCGNCGAALEDNTPVAAPTAMEVEVPAAHCLYCGKEIQPGSPRCVHCGYWLDGSHINDPNSFINPNAAQQPKVVIYNYNRKTNGFGVAGFLFAILAIITSFIPGLNLTLCPVFTVLGLLLSFVGLFFPSKGLAIVGFILSAVPFVLLFLIGGTIFALVGQ